MNYQNFNQAVKEQLTENDISANRQIFNDLKDLYFRDGLITEKQAENWIYPTNKKYYSNSEYQRIKGSKSHNKNQVKELNAILKNELLEAISISECFKNFNDVYKTVLKTHSYELKRGKTIHNIITDFLQGLGLSVEYYNYNILEMFEKAGYTIKKNKYNKLDITNGKNIDLYQSYWGGLASIIIKETEKETKNNKRGVNL